jgi:hypothetical protein
MVLKKDLLLNTGPHTMQHQLIVCATFIQRNATLNQLQSLEKRDTVSCGCCNIRGLIKRIASRDFTLILYESGQACSLHILDMERVENFKK